jgi:hypothetical protein
MLVVLMIGVLLVGGRKMESCRILHRRMMVVVVLRGKERSLPVQREKRILGGGGRARLRLLLELCLVVMLWMVCEREVAAVWTGRGLRAQWMRRKTVGGLRQKAVVVGRRETRRRPGQVVGG